MHSQGVQWQDSVHNKNLTVRITVTVTNFPAVGAILQNLVSDQYQINSRPALPIPKAIYFFTYRSVFHGLYNLVAVENTLPTNPAVSRFICQPSLSLPACSCLLKPTCVFLALPSHNDKTKAREERVGGGRARWVGTDMFTFRWNGSKVPTARWELGTLVSFPLVKNYNYLLKTKETQAHVLYAQYTSLLAIGQWKRMIIITDFFLCCYKSDVCLFIKQI